MKRTQIKDALQVTMALLITGGMASAMAPPVTPTVQTKPISKIEQTVKKPSDANIAPVTALAEQKVAVWQDNPNHCTDAQYIAADAPFNCLDKPVVKAAPASTPAPSVAASVGNCGDNMYKQYIYQHESGCNTDRWNTSGCYGIGQACPASKIAQCGADFACQDAWFSDYAARAYGGWAGAYEFWLAHSWW